MNLVRLTESIKAAEGYRKLPYVDSLGYWTTGFGHLCHNDLLQHAGVLTFGELMAFYSDGERHLRWLEADIKEAIYRAKQWLGDELWNSLDDVRQETLVEMRFQLGERIRNFTGLKKALEMGDFNGAAHEMLDSLWQRQTPQRVQRLAQHMEKGTQPT